MSEQETTQDQIVVSVDDQVEADRCSCRKWISDIRTKWNSYLAEIAVKYSKEEYNFAQGLIGYHDKHLRDLEMFVDNVEFSKDTCSEGTNLITLTIHSSDAWVNEGLKTYLEFSRPNN